MAGAKEFLTTLGVIAGSYFALRWVAGKPALPALPAAVAEPPRLEVILGGRPKGDIVPDFAPVQFDHDSSEFPAAGHEPAQKFARWFKKQ